MPTAPPRSRPAFDSQKEEVFQIAGDEDHGFTTQTNLTANAFAKPQVRYSGKYGLYVLTVDLYRTGTSPILAHLICPVCSVPDGPHGLHIKGENKRIEWESTGGPGVGLLSIERFQCTWELPEMRRQFGLGRCRWTVVIDKNRARDA